MDEKRDQGAIHWLAARLKRQAAREELGKDAPRGQAKGPIQNGPRGYVACATCTRMLGSKRPIGIPVQLAAKHARDHKLGLIRKPVAP